MKGNLILKLLLPCWVFSLTSFGQTKDFCKIQNHTTQSGEVLKYKVYYTLAGAYVGTGEAIFSNKFEMYSGKPVFHVTGFGKSYKSYDWFFKVRDTYESYIDTTTMMPIKFTRNVREGSNRIYNNVIFNRSAANAVTSNGVFKITPCVQDVLSSIYYARNINYDSYKVGDKIPFTMFLDDQEYDIFIRYLGKEKITTKYGTFNAIKFKPLLINGTIFSGGEKMTVWVTDDLNKIPIYIETEILVGKIKVYLIETKGISN